MASDLISRDAMKRYIDCGHLRSPTELCFSELDVVRMLDKQPTVDAEPVRHGEWEVTVCSLCRHDLDGWADGAHEEVADGNVHYCPNCGAKMDGGKQDV